MGRHRVAVLPGDGIGPEVVECALEVLAALAPDLRFDFTEALIGHAAIVAVGHPLPDETVELVREADAVFHGASDSAAVPAGVLSPVRGLRLALGAFANVRPARSYRGIECIHAGVDVVVVRENTEGLHSRLEYMVGDDAACAVSVTTRAASERVAHKAFHLAAQRRRLVTAVHKKGSLPIADGLWLAAMRSVAEHYPSVRLEARNVDAAAHDLVVRPHAFDVIVAENARGDILSDVAAAVVGGLGLTAAGNYGDAAAYFEPVHGTAPDIAGRGIANPAAAIAAAAMMLDYLGEAQAASRVRHALADALAEGGALTPDLGGDATSAEFTNAVIEHIAST